MTAKVKPISKKLRPVLEEFLKSPDMQERFQVEARKLGYDGTDPDKVRVALFTPREDGEICFASYEIESLFVDFQILKALSTLDSCKELMEKHPELIPDLIEASREILLATNIED